MSTVITPLKPGESSDPEVNELLQQSVEGWWNDSRSMIHPVHDEEVSPLAG